MKKILITILILVFSIPAFAETYTVEEVIDGNTLKLTSGEYVRLIGIDTPESKPNKKVQRDSKRTGQDLETIIRMGRFATYIVDGLLIFEGVKITLFYNNNLALHTVCNDDHTNQILFHRPTNHFLSSLPLDITL